MENYGSSLPSQGVYEMIFFLYFADIISLGINLYHLLRFFIRHCHKNYDNCYNPINIRKICSIFLNSVSDYLIGCGNKQKDETEKQNNAIRKNFIYTTTVSSVISANGPLSLA